MKYFRVHHSVYWTAGSLLFIAGIFRAFIRYHIDGLDILLSISGLMSIVWALIKSGKTTAIRPGIAERVRKGMRSFLYLIAGLIIIIEINMAAIIYDRGWDLTKEKQHTLASYTKNYISQLTGNVRLTAFYVDTPPRYLVDMLKAYSDHSKGKITAEIIDPLVDLGYAAQFGNIISGNERKIFIQTDLGRKDIDFTEKPLSEEQVTNEIVRLTRPIRKVYFLAGHNEANIENDEPEGLSRFAELLGQNRIDLSLLVIGENGTIPEDCDVLVIAGPKADLSKSEEAVIREYLYRGGDALLMPENVYVTTPDQPLTEKQKSLYPSLNGILSDWGLKVNDDIVVDLASHVGGDVGSPATRNYMPHRSIVKNVDYTFFLRPRSISLRHDRRQTINLAPVILTASDKQSWGETDRYLQVKFDSEDRPGPVPFAYVAFEPRHVNKKNSDTRLFVLTDTDFISNQFIDEYSNGILAMNIINWLAESDYNVFMKPKDMDVVRLDLTSQQKRVVLSILLAMPLLIMAQGVAVWMRR